MSIRSAPGSLSGALEHVEQPHVAVALAHSQRGRRRGCRRRSRGVCDSGCTSFRWSERTISSRV
jgi:hypothetical protein